MHAAGLRGDAAVPAEFRWNNGYLSMCGRTCPWGEVVNVNQNSMGILEGQTLVEGYYVRAR